MKRLIAYCLLLPMTLAGASLAAVIVIAVLSAPYLLYVAQSPSVEIECGQIRPGMDMNEVLEIISKHAEPLEEDYDETTLLFSRKDATCEVRFQPGTSSVSLVRLVKNEGFDRRRSMK